MSPTSLSIAVLHAHPAQCEALCDAIADEVGFRVVGGAGNGEELLAILRGAVAHVLVLDLASAGEDAQALVSAVRAESPRTGVLLLLHGQGAAQVEPLMARGAGGYLEMARAGSDMAAALRTIGMGRRYLPDAPPALIS